jgi:small subunit ribosomal protein SAe
MATEKFPSILSATPEDVQLMLAAQCHIGTKNCDKSMEGYVWKRRADGELALLLFGLRVKGFGFWGWGWVWARKGVRAAREVWKGCWDVVVVVRGVLILEKRTGVVWQRDWRLERFLGLLLFWRRLGERLTRRSRRKRWTNRSQMLLDGGVPDKDNFTVPSRQREHKIWD